MSKSKKKNTKQSNKKRAKEAKEARDEKTNEDDYNNNQRYSTMDDDNNNNKKKKNRNQQLPSASGKDNDSDNNQGMDPPSVIVSSNSLMGDETNLSDGDDHQSIFGDDDYNSGMYRGKRGKRYCLSTLRFFGIMAFLWICQFAVTTSMHHFGVLDGEERMRFDFDPSIVAQRVIPQLQENWNNMNNMFNESMSLASTYYTRESQRPGYLLAQHGASVHYPVVLIPGFVTSGLEVWTSRECAKKYFRQRIWTGLESARALFTDKNCWREHVALDPYTGRDPEGIRLRAAEGFEAADYFMANYWVWEKLLENLADLGYSPSTMSIEPYDWRLAFPLLEERDGYLTKLMYKIEAMHKSSGKKVVMASHSMGAQLVHFFFKWVTTPERLGGGGGGKKWVDEHVHAYLNVAGSHLGVPKAASALLSGEMKDTVIMGTIGNMAEQWFGRKLRKDLWNTWGSLWGMLPKGGDRIWDIGADVCYSVTDPEDPFCGNVLEPKPKEKMDARVPFMYLKRADEASGEQVVCGVDASDPSVCRNETIFQIPHDDTGINATVNRFANAHQHTTGEVIEFLRDWGAGLGSDLASSKLYSDYGNTKIKQRNKPKIEWLDTTITPLPYAPNLKIYCMYGVGLDSERNYFYKVNNEATAGTTDDGNSSTDNKPRRPNKELPFILDLNKDDLDRKIKHGMRFTDGDGSVPLLSLGYICADAWTRKDSGLNPSGTEVITLEYKNQNEFTPDDPFRGGPRSADHVDILGNIGMTEDFLRVVADFEPRNESHIVSNLREVAKAINQHPNGGIFKKKKGIFRK